MSATHFGGDDLSGGKGVGQDSKGNVSSAAPLPYMDANEINRRLEEHAKLLKEWEELLTRTSAPDVHSLSQTDAQRHIYLKRKLHESLGVMARIVQNQIKLKKTSTDTQPSTTPPPVMVAPPTTSGYQPMGAGQPAMMLQQMNYNTDPHAVPGVQQMYGNTYTYNTGFVPGVPQPGSGGEAQPTFYNYNLSKPNVPAGRNAPHMMPTTQMYVSPGVNYNPAYVPPQPVQQPGAGQGSGPQQFAPRGPAQMRGPQSHASASAPLQQNTGGHVYGQYAPAGGNPQQQTNAYTMAPQAYGTAADSTGMTYGQQLRPANMPTTYYGNTGAVQGAPQQQHQQHQQHQQQQMHRAQGQQPYPPHQQQAQQQHQQGHQQHQQHQQQQQQQSQQQNRQQ